MTQAKKKTLKNTPPEEWVGWVVGYWRDDYWDALVTCYDPTTDEVHLVYDDSNDPSAKWKVSEIRELKKRIA